jgi:sugar (pentulose or hexulose) kinase
MQCLGIDIGSTTIKGAELDLERGQVGKVVRERFPDPIAGLPPRHFEVDPERIVAVTRSVIDQLVAAAPESAAVFFSGQMGGVILVDDGGRPLTNYLSWRDQRTLDSRCGGGSYVDEIERRWSAGELREVGNELKPGSGTSLLFWLAENGRLPAAGTPCGIGDFVVSRLCGAPPGMHPTQAIGLLNLHTCGWHHTAFDRLGIGALKWPPLAELRIPIGKTAHSGRRIPCYPVLGDQQCALYGIDLQENELSLNVSTGSQVSRITRELQLGPYQSRRHVDDRYLNTITHLPAGRSLNVLVDLLTELTRAEGRPCSSPWAHIARLAADADGGGLECELSFFAGPLGDSGRIEHITTENLTVGNLFRAAFRNMAANYGCCAERLDPDCSWTRLALSGGLTQSVPVLRQLIQQQFSAPIREFPEGEDVLNGLLRVAQTCLH